MQTYINMLSDIDLCIELTQMYLTSIYEVQNSWLPSIYQIIVLQEETLGEK
jgi:hypothetical protein